MKICRKCKQEYKNEYIFCPKCGTPYDNKMKAVRTPGDFGKIFETATKIWNVILYVFGSLLILAYITTFTENIVASIFAILFGLSLFKVFYTLAEDNFVHINKKYIKVARISIPIILLIVWMACTPVEDDQAESKAPQIEIVEKDENTTSNESSNQQNNSNNENNTEIKDDDIENPQATIYHIKYNELGEFGKYMEYENENEIFYYLPNGKYKIEATNINENICFLWIDYREGYQNGSYGTAYNNKERLIFTSSSKTNTATIDSTVHIFNSNNCDYKFTLID